MERPRPSHDSDVSSRRSILIVEDDPLTRVLLIETLESAGFEVFSSAKLIDEHHEPAVYKGNFNYKLVEGKAKILNAAGEVDVEASKKLWDFSITKNVASLFISVIILLLVIMMELMEVNPRNLKPTRMNYPH